MQKIHKRLAPDNITELSQCEVFVFGSNLEGQHMGGAARYAYDHFGATIPGFRNRMRNSRNLVSVTHYGKRLYQESITGTVEQDS